eukprot:Skav232996  [mRNA]  locus=scaffold387:198801:199037:+ [translate_table: standard]
MGRLFNRGAEAVQAPDIQLWTGSSHTNNVRLYDVIAHGCVPIIVSDDFQPPLDRLLPWKDGAVSAFMRKPAVLMGVHS